MVRLLFAFFAFFSLTLSATAGAASLHHIESMLPAGSQLALSIQQARDGKTSRPLMTTFFCLPPAPKKW